MPLPTATIRSRPRRRRWPRKSARSCADSPQATLRLNKYISETGVCSRREADKWIEAGRGTCHSQVAPIGNRVVGGDEKFLHGAPPSAKKKPTSNTLQKPVGLICDT